jgi:hypothetical protein
MRTRPAYFELPGEELYRFVTSGQGTRDRGPAFYLPFTRASVHSTGKDI